MTGRDRDDVLRWCDRGTRLFGAALGAVGDEELAGPTTLPGWTGQHLAAHVAANGEALRNLVHWAATGEETPMYSSPQQRADDIETGARLPGAELRRWVDRSAARLAEALGALPADRWDSHVRTAQGRTVPATEIPWLRARETMVHAVDLGSTATFDDLPDDFLLALVDDVVAKRSTGSGPALELVCATAERTWTVDGEGEAVRVDGPITALAAYLTGRPGPDVVVAGAHAAPVLPPWL